MQRATRPTQVFWLLIETLIDIVALFMIAIALHFAKIFLSLLILLEDDYIDLGY